MARKGNPISVRLDLNRSSDSSRFSDIFASILTLISSIVTKMILSITLLIIMVLLIKSIDFPRDVDVSVTRGLWLPTTLVIGTP